MDIGVAELVTDRSTLPTRFAQRPEFERLVEAGELPPVMDRIGKDPLVLRAQDGIGTYGGVLRRAYLAATDPLAYATRFCAGPDSLLYWDAEQRRVIPNIARDFAMSEDSTELIVHLRRGMRWSDGAPFTASDIVFWRNHISLNPDICGGAPSLRVDGREVTVERIDDYTIRYVSPAPHPLLPNLLASGMAFDVGGQSIGGGGRFGGGGFAPRHYLEQFHPSYTSEAEANQRACDAGYPDWVSYFWNRNSWHLNTELPTLTPWILTRPADDPPWRMVANPYSIWVDIVGNQLPYIGEITMERERDRESLALSAARGEIDFQSRSLDVAQLPVLLQNQERGGYTLFKTPREGMDIGILINLAYDTDPVLGELLRRVEFRRALALGVDRDQINQEHLLGTSVPSATMASDASPYFPGKEWRSKWAVHDPAAANDLLDELGLAETDADGFRLRPHGDERITLDYQNHTDAPPIGEMLRDQWAEIGIDLTVQNVAADLYIKRIRANEIMLSGHPTGTEDPFLAPGGLVLAESGPVSSIIGVPYLRWYATQGREGVEPPDSLLLLKRATAMYRAGRKLAEADRIELGKELYRLHADQVWSIGIVGFGIEVMGMYLAKNELRNVPTHARSADYLRSPANTFPMTFYYKSRSVSRLNVAEEDSS